LNVIFTLTVFSRPVRTSDSSAPGINREVINAAWERVHGRGKYRSSTKVIEN